MVKIMAAAAILALLASAVPGLVWAQDETTPSEQPRADTGAYPGSTSGTGMGDGSNWGWIGLLGLLGLAGFWAGRRRNVRT